MITDYRATYMISSRRNRSDEKDVMFFSNAILNVGDTIELDGITWDVLEVVRDADRNIPATEETEEYDEDEMYDILVVTLVDEAGYSLESAKSLVDRMLDDGIRLEINNLCSYMAERG